ncbi:MAG: ribonuclease HI family protein [Candidatus Babeliales bacterium]
MESVSSMSTWTLYTDGASRHNPGKAGAGIIILKNNQPFLGKGFFLGIKTNNQAEYLALLLGIFYVRSALHHDERARLTCFSDSQLLVRQVLGHYRVKNKELIPLHALACSWLMSFDWKIEHIYREENKRADAYANKGLESQKVLPSLFQLELKRQGIVL